MISENGISTLNEFLEPMIKMIRFAHIALLNQIRSDSAALTTKAERTNEGFKVNGTKLLLRWSIF